MDSVKEDSLGRVAAGQLARIYEATGSVMAERYRARGAAGR
jgi:hypothetical protein